MAATLGLRGTGAFSSDERPQNWREKILQLFPNGEAPLTALVSKLRSQPTTDYTFNWWEKRLPTQRMQVNGAHTAAALAINVDSGAKDAVNGTLVLNETSGEILLVTTDPTADTQLPVVTRSWGAVVATAMADDEFLTVIGNIHEQGAAVPTPKSYAPTKKTNLTQIFRMPLSLTRTAKKTYLRWDNTGPYREAKREALSLYSIEMEKAFLWGEQAETTGVAGLPLYSTDGIKAILTTNKPSGTASANFGIDGTLDEATWDAICEDLFRYGSNEKMVLAGSTFLRAITTLAKRNGTLNMVPQDKVYGMKIVDYTSAFGTLYLKNHPLLSQHPVWRKDAFVVDTGNLVYRYVDETRFLKNRQNPGDDLSKDEYLGECGLETEFEETHGYVRGVTDALIV